LGWVNGQRAFERYPRSSALSAVKTLQLELGASLWSSPESNLSLISKVNMVPVASEVVSWAGADWDRADLSRSAEFASPAPAPVRNTPVESNLPKTPDISLTSWTSNESSSVSRSTDAGGGGTVYVRGYYRKDGAYVRSHTRSAPRR
jgi:hypothetical protein